MKRVYQHTDSKHLSLLTTKRIDLLRLLDLSHINHMDLTLRALPEPSNEYGKLLARSIRMTQSSLYIPIIPSQTEGIVNTSECITAVFQAYYAALYDNYTRII